MADERINPHYPVVETRIPQAARQEPGAISALVSPEESVSRPPPVRRTPDLGGVNPFPNVRAVLRGAREDMAAAATPWQAAGHAVRGGLAAVPAAVVDASPFPGPARTAGVRDMLTTAFTGQPPSAMTPIADAVPAAASGTPNAMDARLSRGPAAAVTPPAASAPAVSATSVPGVTRIDGGAAPVFTNVPGTTAESMAAQPVSVANMAAADAVAARSVAPAAAQPGDTPALHGALIPGVTAPPSQAVQELQERNARFDEEALENRAITMLNHRRGRSGAMAAQALAGAAADRRARRIGSRDAAARETAATQRTAMTDAGATQRNRETIAATERREGPLRAVQGAKAALDVRGMAQVQAAQDEYRAAVASGDKAAIERAEDALRAIQGKWEKQIPTKFSGVAIPGGIDPATGLSRGSGVAVIDQSTGNVRVLSPDEAKGQPQQQQPKFEQGKVYVDGQGRRATWDGTKFVPAK